MAATLLVLFGGWALFAVVSHGRYASPEGAVRATCHPAQVYPSLDAGRVKWMTAGTDPHVWIATVDHSLGGYRVVSCRAEGVAHG